MNAGLRLIFVLMGGRVSPAFHVPQLQVLIGFLLGRTSVNTALGVGASCNAFSSVRSRQFCSSSGLLTAWLIALGGASSFATGFPTRPICSHLAGGTANRKIRRIYQRAVSAGNDGLAQKRRARRAGQTQRQPARNLEISGGRPGAAVDAGVKQHPVCGYGIVIRPFACGPRRTHKTRALTF